MTRYLNNESSLDPGDRDCSLFQIYDLCLTLSTEVDLIWGRRASLSSILYLVTRYLPFLDSVVTLMGEFQRHGDNTKPSLNVFAKDSLSPNLSASTCRNVIHTRISKPLSNCIEFNLITSLVYSSTIRGRHLLHRV